MDFIRKSSLLWVILFSFLLRLFWVMITPSQPVSDFAWYDQVARNVAVGLGHTYSGEPTALRPPAYPLFLAGIYYFTNGSLLAGRLANVFLGTATVILTYFLALQYFSPPAALWGSTLVAFIPSLILYSGIHASENLAIPLTLATMLCTQIGIDKDHAGWLFLSGLLLGAASLTRGLLVLLPGAWIAWLYLRGATFRRLITLLVWISLGLAIPLLPWIIRNAVTFGQFIPISTNSGINLLVGFNPLSRGGYVPGDQIPGLSELREQGLDEYRFDQATRDMAIEFIQAEPLRALLLAPLKAFHMYLDDISGVNWNNSDPQRPIPKIVTLGLKILAQGYYILLMLMALAALFSYRKLPRDGRWVFVLTPILYLTLFHMIYFGDDRYHLPLLPYIAIIAGFQARQFWEKYVTTTGFNTLSTKKQAA